MSAKKVIVSAFALIFVLSTFVLTAYGNDGYYSATESMHQSNPGSTVAQSYTDKPAAKSKENHQDDDGDSDSDEEDTEEDDNDDDEDDYSSEEEENNELPGAPEEEGAGENGPANPSTPSTPDVPTTVASQ